MVSSHTFCVFVLRNTIRSCHSILGTENKNNELKDNNNRWFLFSIYVFVSFSLMAERFSFRLLGLREEEEKEAEHIRFNFDLDWHASKSNLIIWNLHTDFLPKFNWFPFPNKKSEMMKNHKNHFLKYPSGCRMYRPLRHSIENKYTAYDRLVSDGDGNPFSSVSGDQWMVNLRENASRNEVIFQYRIQQSQLVYMSGYNDNFTNYYFFPLHQDY